MSLLSTGMQQVIITRPEQDAASWAGSLEEAGFKVSLFPLLDLSDFMAAPEAQKACELLLQSQAVMFVSANAVRFLAKALAESTEWLTHFQQGARAWCTGPGTAAALKACGIPKSQIDQPSNLAAQLDSESLWQVVSDQVTPGMRVLFIRGADESGAIAGRDWLAHQLENAQVNVQAVAAYRRLPTLLSPALQAQASAYVAQDAVWLFSSSAAIESLMSQCPSIDWSKAKAVVTHPRMAQLAQKSGWQQVSIAAPGIRSMLASIKSLA